MQHPFINISIICRDRGLTNLTVFTGDVAVFDDPQFKQAFDRVISIGRSGNY